MAKKVKKPLNLADHQWNILHGLRSGTELIVRVEDKQGTRYTRLMIYLKPVPLSQVYYPLQNADTGMMSSLLRRGLVLRSNIEGAPGGAVDTRYLPQSRQVEVVRITQRGIEALRDAGRG